MNDNLFFFCMVLIAASPFILIPGIDRYKQYVKVKAKNQRESYDKQLDVAVPELDNWEELPVETDNLLWNIRKFKVRYTMAKEFKAANATHTAELASFEFEAGKTVGVRSKWQFSIGHASANSYHDENKFISLNLRLLSIVEENDTMHNPLWRTKITNNPNVNGIFADFQVYIQKLNGQLRHHKDFPLTLFYISESKTIQISPLSSLMQLGFVNEKDELQLKIKMNVYGSPTKWTSKAYGSYSMISTADQWKEALQKKLGEHLAKLLNSGEGSDVTLSVPYSPTQKKIHNLQGMHKVKAHRQILIARSPYFATFFKSETPEEVVLDDMHSSTLDILLKYIYTGELSSIDEYYAEEIIKAADKYQLADLKSYLNENVAEVCTIRNAQKLLKLTKQLSLDTAKKGITDFIQRNFKDCIENLD